jgi:O-antigen ligase
VLAAAVVVARATMLETLRNPLDVYPGSDAVPRGPGAGTGVVLDVVACFPGLLVLARRVLDPRFVLRRAWSFLPLAGLAVLIVASTTWSGDRFAAAVSGFHWLAASVLLWSAAQLVRDWAHLRLVAAVAFGLLLVQIGQGLYYRYVEFPELRAQWEKNKAEILRQRGWEPGSFHALQFEKRLVSGEIMGFNSSENSFGAVVVLLATLAAGVMIQRVVDDDGPAWAAVAGAGAALGILVICHLRSRTAYATPVIGAAALAAVWVLRRWLGRHARLGYACGVALVVLALAAVVGHGLYHGTLPSDSLAFRWRYWTASARLFTQHPLAGVGWDNFGPHYLAVRLPVAAEEIKDPHNFVVRFATELGGVGLLLLVAWMLSLWWELSRAVTPVADEHDTAAQPALPPLRRIGPGARPDPSPALAMAVAVGVVAMVINVLASIDWSQSVAFVSLELMRRVGFLCLFLVGSAAVAVRSAQSQDLDDRRAPWVLYALMVGLGLFLVHNLVDFSLFEPGPMTLFMFLCGAALGVRLDDPATASAGRPRVATGMLIGLCIAWVVVAGTFVAPLVMAEQAAAEGDEALRLRSAARAADDYARALDAVPYNADYAFRAGRALLFAPDARPHADRAVAMLDRAAALDPDRAEYWLARANAESLRPNPDAAQIRGGYERALGLDPNSVQVRLEYAALLRRLGDPAGARGQYQAALRYNDLLSPDEPKRLSAEKVEQVRKAIAELGGAG